MSQSDDPNQDHKNGVPESHLLPAPTQEGSESPSHSSNKLDLAGNLSVKLDALGPMVVNSDGTLSRIANWTEMTDAEQERTLRVLSARNRVRLADEKRKQEDNSGASQTQ